MHTLYSKSSINSTTMDPPSDATIEHTIGAAPVTPPPKFDGSSTCNKRIHKYTLYFVRHGEALHNALEKQAQSAALSQAIAQGLDPNSAHVQKIVEEARKAVLGSDSMEDPPLSKLGVEQAKKAKRDLERLIAAYELPAVEEVWVSPLQRTLQTAAIVFPKTSSTDLAHLSTKSSETSNSGGSLQVVPIIRVRKEIEERHTGLLCDMHSPVGKLTHRPTFNRFSFSALKMASVENFLKSCCQSFDGNGEEYFQDRAEENDRTGDANRGLVMEKDVSIGAFLNFLDASEHHIDDPWDQEVIIDAIEKIQCIDANTPQTTKESETETEDKCMLRERTKKLFTLLTETESRSIALIGHKGYLRELERGPLGHADADLFENCEVRVYRLVLDFCVDGDDDDHHGDRIGNVSFEDVVQNNNSRGSVAEPVIQRAVKIASSHDVGV